MCFLLTAVARIKQIVAALRGWPMLETAAAEIAEATKSRREIP
jgi:hypothetical protein